MQRKAVVGSIKYLVFENDTAQLLVVQIHRHSNIAVDITPKAGKKFPPPLIKLEYKIECLVFFSTYYLKGLTPQNSIQGSTPEYPNQRQKTSIWNSPFLVSAFFSSLRSLSPRLVDAAPTNGEPIVFASTGKYAKANGKELRIAAIREIIRVHGTPTTSWPALSSLVQTNSMVNVCGETAATLFRKVGTTSFSACPYPRVLRSDILIFGCDSSGVPWWKWFCLLQSSIRSMRPLARRKCGAYLYFLAFGIFCFGGD